MSSFITSGDLRISIDSREDDRDELPNPHNSVRSETGEGLRLQLTASVSKISTELTVDAFDEDDENDQDASKVTSVAPAYSTTTCDLFENLASIQVAEVDYPDFALVQRLRCRAHSLLLFAVAHSIYLVSILNGVRLKALDMLHPETKFTRRITDVKHPDPVNVTIIGCGRLGKSLIKAFLTYGMCEPRSITVGTRHPGNNELIINKGIKMTTDNKEAARNADIVFVCVPNHLHIDVLKQLNVCIKSSCTVVTFVSHFTAKKLRFYTPNIRNLLRPEYELGEANQTQQNIWDCTKTFPEILSQKSYVQVTCPLMQTANREASPQPRRASFSPVKVTDRLLDTFFYAAFNHCCELGLSWEQTIDCLNIVVFNSRCNSEDHAIDRFIEMQNVLMIEESVDEAKVATATTGYKISRSTASSATPSVNLSRPSSRTRTREDATTRGSETKELERIENQIDDFIKMTHPVATNLIDIYEKKWTPFGAALYDDTDESVYSKRRVAYRKGYLMKFRKYIDWLKWNRAPDVSFIS